MTPKNSNKDPLDNKIQVSYQAMCNWLDKAEAMKGQPESRLFIRNAEAYANRLKRIASKIDISKELHRLTQLKKQLSR